MKTVFALLMIWAPGMAAADDGPMFGPEFTFYDPDENRFTELLNKASLHLIEGQPEGAKFKLDNATLISPNGWHFTVMRDFGVVEVKMKPMTVKAFEKFSADINDAIFVSASNLGLYPALYQGGGHINLDVGYFASKPPLVFRNFIVDLINHAELSLGVFNYDTCNATSYSLLNDLRGHVQRIVARFDAGEFGDIRVPSPEVLYKLIDPLKNSQMFPDVFRALWKSNIQRGTKSTAISFANAGNMIFPGRLEIRSVRPQASLDVWLRQIRLIRDRIAYIERSFHEPIPFAPWYVLPRGEDAQKILLTPPVSAHEAMRHFYMYIEGAGHKWADHRDYLWPQWIFPQPGSDKTELQKFEDSSWFRCRELLKRRAA